MNLLFGAKMPGGKGPEYQGKNYSEKDYREHDPHANPLEGLSLNKAEEVLDLENFYNEPGFEDRKIYNDVVDDSVIGGEVGELMEKYGLENEWELVDLLKNSEDDGKNKVRPLASPKESHELALFYREYLAAKNENGLPFSDEELKSISEKDQQELLDLYRQRGEIAFKIANLNETVDDSKIVDEKQINANSELVFSTEEKTFTPKMGAQYKYDLRNVEKRIVELEKLIPTPSNRKEQNPWKEIPKYSEAEISLRKSCINHLRDRINPRPTFADGQVLSKEQVLEMAREEAIEEKWPKASFSEEVFHGQRQLTFVERSGNKRIKYIFLSNNLPAGEYFFETNPDKFFVSKNGDHLAIAPVRLMLETSKREEKAEDLKASA
jgi:hypothetical protein